MKKETHVLVTFDLSKTDRDRIRSVADGISLTVMPMAHVEEIPAARWAEADVLYTSDVFPAPGAAPNLKWIQLYWAGVDSLVENATAVLKNVKVTTMSGVIASQVAEYVLMTMLALGHQLPKLRRFQQESQWPQDDESKDTLIPVELRHSTVAILGYGSIGRQVARLLQPFGATVLAIKNDVMHPEDSGYSLEGRGDPNGEFFHRLYPMAALKSVLAESDFVVVTLPLTEATRGILDAEALGVMKESAYLVNVGRGALVDQEALIEALENEQIAGAALDVFTEEPLPEGNPLWQMDQVIISPHISWLSERLHEETLALFSENLKRFITGAPLYNEIDLEKGY